MKFFDSRGIRKDTMDFWRVKQAKTKLNDKVQIAMTFPCYDEDGELKHITYRGAKKQVKQSYKTLPILYGMWHIRDFDTLVITEGQIDCMSVWQSGFENVVSIPAGAGNNSNILWAILISLTRLYSLALSPSPRPPAHGRR